MFVCIAHFSFYSVIELLILYSLVYFTEFLNRQLIFYDFLVQLKWSGRIYTLMAVSGLISINVNH